MSHQWHYDYPKIARDSGFTFKQVPNGTLDWRLIGSIEVEKLIREKGFERVDSIIAHLTEAPLASMLDTNILDSGIAKYFSLSQMAIQYLVFCKKFLDETVTSLRETLVEFQTENFKLTKQHQENSNELLQLHKKLQRVEAINEVVYPCTMCTKNFVSNEMLNTHIKRKHPTNKTGDLTEKNNDKNLINTIKLELEIKHLKERLNVTEKQIREKNFSFRNDQENSHTCSVGENYLRNVCTTATQIDSPSTRNIGIQSNLMEAKEKDDSFGELGGEINSDVLVEIQDKICEFENWKQTETESNHKSINDIQQKLDEIVVTLDEKNRHNAELLRSVVDNAISQTSVGPPAPSPMPLIGDQIQQQISETLEKITQTNEKNLNTIVQKIEVTYDEKLKVLEEEIRRQNEKLSSEFLTASRESLLDRQEAAKELRTIQQQLQDRQMARVHQTENKIAAINDSPTIVSIKQSKPMVYLEDVPSSTVESESLTDSDQSDESAEVTPKMSTWNAQFPESSKIPNLPLPKKEPPRSKQKSLPTIEFRRVDAIKLADKRLSKIGFETKAKGISKLSAEQASLQLAESRDFNKKLYPNFYVTRNKFKKFVDRLCFEKKTNKEKTKTTVRTRKDRNEVTKRMDFSSQESIEEPDFDQGSVKTTQAEKPSIDDFKMRLEKILESPIRRPNPFSVTKVNNPVIHKKNSEQTQDDAAQKKPVPIPRKRVMFDFPAVNKTEAVHSNDKRFTQKPHEMYQESELDTSSNVSSIN